ncbi:response regulator [Planctomycetota bacterium]
MHEERPVLLIEHEHEDAMTFRRILGLAVSPSGLVHAQDKEGALLYLQERAIKPQLIIMNVDAPQMTAVSFLRILKQDPVFKSIPVVALAGQRCVDTINSSFSMGIAGYMVKDEDPSQFTTKLAVIIDYWGLNRLPLMELLHKAAGCESATPSAVVPRDAMF